ncbi:TonB-dependent receptor [Emticicia agri]|uniref:TonB-dependent receptor n=1 Tax=Emticicia agri TaxID=2492393 RepID=A0A4Q5M3X5_9BACT|nr:TonB-dependent receptor plug domain-containing protein [Emticicia agri]RYU96613.1 TonB-dependent receptor [Emticicia agri]
MKKLLSIFAVAATLFAFTFPVDLADSIVSQFNKYAGAYPQEKAYLHLDKPYYTAGETIWLKAYLIEAATNVLDTASIPLNVELIDNQLGRVVEKKILKLEGGMAAGDFELSDSLHSGYYRLRAYTNWMKNFDESLMFSKEFKVYKIGEEILPVKFNAQEIDFQFFPEGGQIVEGLDNKIAFKATDKVGNGIDVSGVIISDKEDTVMVFGSEHLGMGVFNFKAVAGETYRAKIKYRNIFEKEVPFPAIEKEGFIMGVEGFVDKKVIRLYVGHNYNKPKGSGDIVVVGQSQGRICYVARTPAHNKAMSVKIPRDKFPEGVAQFTAFDETGRPRCERLVYIYKEDYVNVSITSDKRTYLPKEEVKLEIEAKDMDGEPVAGNFSVVVSDGKQVLMPAHDENIMTYLLLSSDVKGKIEEPDYYFSQTKPEVRRHMDILMLTQGWRRFKWEDIMKPTLPEPVFALERGIGISGEITRPSGKLFEKPVNITFMLWLGEDDRQFGTGQADAEGRFSLQNLDFTGTGKILVQAVVGKLNRNTKIFINRPMAPKLQRNLLPFNPITFDENDLADYLKRTADDLAIEKLLRERRERMLQEVTIKAKREKEREDRVLYSHATNSLKITPDMQVSGNVIDLLRGRVPGVQVLGSASDPTVIIRGISSMMGSTEPTYLLDGMMVDKMTLLSIPVFDVDKIDVLKGADAAIYGSRGGNGVISVLTKRGSPSNDGGPPQGIDVSDIYGYAVPKEFYSPNHAEASMEDFTANARPDYRSTIHWAPIVKTNAKGKAKLSFFNTNAETTVDIRLEGMALAGMPVRAKSSYLVKR